MVSAPASYSITCLSSFTKTRKGKEVLHFFKNRTFDKSVGHFFFLDLSLFPCNPEAMNSKSRCYFMNHTDCKVQVQTHCICTKATKNYLLFHHWGPTKKSCRQSICNSHWYEQQRQAHGSLQSFGLVTQMRQNHPPTMYPNPKH
ncbi:hypothetical protein KP509_17G057300 [Ceratopteris richardii]|uniref:Uncharacterized protein n=1 Tax=Ceratopteris richardii TaxID=49495 RepID=A0A8T2SY16_CERRI|nr:hypothetical protein KP509_17G057300 [Ceratopteris richardii]